MNVPVIVKQNWPILLGGAVGLYVVAKYMVPESSSGVNMGAYYSAQAQTAALNNQTNAQLTQASMQHAAQKYALDLEYELEQGKLEAAINNANLTAINNYNASIGDMALKGATAGAETIKAYLTLPAQVINAVSNENQAALAAAAKVAAVGIAATPANLQGAADLLQASYKPLDYVGKLMTGFSANSTAMSANAINAIANMSADISANTGRVMSELGQSAANANAQATMGTTRMIGQIAMAAAMA